MNKFFIGLGTGRCGTKSLSKLLELQGINLKHEFDTQPNEGLPLPWDKNINELRNRLDSLINNGLDGDIGFYYLPYVDDIINIIPNVKFIVLKRDRLSTINSYIKWVGNRNHWMVHDGSMWTIDPKWDRAYPKYQSNIIEDAVGEYYDNYYAICEDYEKKIKNFKIFKTEDLNDSEKVKDILEFLGVDNKQIVTNIKENEKK